jgi:hypothetical protein
MYYVENIKSTNLPKPRTLMPTKKSTFTVSNIANANTQAPLNICNTMYRTKTNDTVEALHYVWYRILNHFYRGHFNVVSPGLANSTPIF